MNRRNYKELWEQLKVLVVCGSKKRYNQGELYKVMSDLELLQLCQDPLREILQVTKE